MTSAALPQDFPQWLLNRNHEPIAPLYVTQELNRMVVGSSAHPETERRVRELLALSPADYPGFVYLYADGRIVIAQGAHETLVGYYELRA